MKKYISILLSLLFANAAFNVFASPGSIFCKAPAGHSTLSFYEKEGLQGDSDLLNKPAPPFQLQDMNGQTIALERLKGKIVVLNFWFVACKPCVNEMPVLNTIKDSYDSGKVVFLALSLDNKATINNFLKEHTFEYTILPAADPVAEKYGLFAYPASMVIDARGIVRFVQVGGPNISKNLPDAINAIL